MFAFLALQLFLSSLPRIRLSIRTSHEQQRQNRKQSGVNICPLSSGMLRVPSPCPSVHSLHYNCAYAFSRHTESSGILASCCTRHLTHYSGRVTQICVFNTVKGHLQVLLSATPQGGMFPGVSHPQALLGSLVSISWKFQFTKIVSEFVINF